MIPTEAVEQVAAKLIEMAEREERLLADGLPYRQDRISATAHAKAWRIAARMITKAIS